MDYENTKQDNIYASIGMEVGNLVKSKQEAYGDAFTKSSEMLSLLYPCGVNVDQYSDMLTIVRVLDKLFRVATDKDAFGESPYKDIIGYGILGYNKDNNKKSKN